MKIFLTSDTHFGHTNIIKYDNRPFHSVEEHDGALILRWNTVVGPGDVVWHLGDVARTVADARRIVPQLNGSIHLLAGNHDDDIIRQAKDLFASVGQVKYLRREGNRYFLSHYNHRVWRNSHYGSFHFFGHSHGTLNDFVAGTRAIDVGVMNWGYAPVPLETLHDQLVGNSFVNHH